MKKLERKWYLIKININYGLEGRTSLDTSPFSKSNVMFSTSFGRTSSFLKIAITLLDFCNKSKISNLPIKPEAPNTTDVFSIA